MKKIFAALSLLVAMTACGGAQEGMPLEGTTWKLAKMESIPAQTITAEADYFTLQFDAADTLVSGMTNCNRFFGKYAVKGNELKLDNLGMTRMACPEMEYEQSFVEMLESVNHFEIKGSELTLLNEQKTLAVFKAEVEKK